MRGHTGSSRTGFPTLNFHHATYHRSILERHAHDFVSQALSCFLVRGHDQKLGIGPGYEAMRLHQIMQYLLSHLLCSVVYTTTVTGLVIRALEASDRVKTVQYYPQQITHTVCILLCSSHSLFGACMAIAATIVCNTQPHPLLVIQTTHTCIT